MHTDLTAHVNGSTPVFGYILPVSGKNVGYLKIGTDETHVVMILTDPAFLDRLSNEAERLCRELVGDAAPLLPLDTEPTRGPVPA